MEQAQRCASSSSNDGTNACESAEDDVSNEITADMLPQCSVELERSEQAEALLRGLSPMPFVEEDGSQYEGKNNDVAMSDIFYVPDSGEESFLNANNWEQESLVADDDLESSSDSSHYRSMSVLMMAREKN